VTVATTSRLDIDGASLSYVVEGDGGVATGVPALAFAHGWCSKLEHWSAQAECFSASGRVVRWDRRGMGRSTTAEPASGPERHADDLVAILDSEGIDRVVVAGHAGGGPSALTFAARHPSRTAALVMVDTRVHRPVPAGERDAFAAGIERSVERLRGPDGRTFFDRLYRSFFGPRADPAIVEDAVANALATSLDVAVAEMRHISGDTASVAARVTCPVLWVSAQPDDSAAVAAAFPAAAGGRPTVGHVVGSGHFVQLEVPEQLNPMIEVFLAEL
jgi:pimeloyl-ACP methyl ester carboxylesterase